MHILSAGMASFFSQLLFIGVRWGPQDDGIAAGFFDGCVRIFSLHLCHMEIHNFDIFLNVQRCLVHAETLFADRRMSQTKSVVLRGSTSVFLTPS